MSEWIAAALAWAGAVVAFARLSWKTGPTRVPGTWPTPPVSIIIPARNEERNLPPLLESLQSLDYPAFEIIVINDGSSDRTVEIARTFGVQVLESAPPPPGWNPKNWACHQAARVAKGELLFFTDADTVHRPEGLKKAVTELKRYSGDLLSCLPWHRCPTRWERCLGPFHALLLIATAPKTPRRRRLFAIGQFLLFDRGFYERCGGHAAIANQYPDDLALANLCLERDGRYRVVTAEPLFDVRMYASFGDFIRGWRRNIQAGLRQSSLSAAIETTLVVAALLAGGRPSAGWITIVPMMLTLAIIWRRQRHWGEFSAAGVVLFPFSLALYMTATALAVWDWLRGGRLQWKERELSDWTASRGENPPGIQRQ